MNTATRTEVVFSRVMELLPELVNEDNVQVARYMGNILWRVGPPFQVLIMSAGEGGPEHITVAVAKNLESRVKRLMRSCPLKMRVGIYSMVPTYKQALKLREQIIEVLDSEFPDSHGGWYRVSAEDFEKATVLATKIVHKAEHATLFYRYDPKVKPEAIAELRKRVEALRDAIEEEMPFN